MQCPHCACLNTRVIDSRPADQNSAIRRRRACEECGGRFTTYERAVPVLTVRKRSGRLEPFSSDKLRRGMEAALADRPVAPGRVDQLVEEIELELQTSGSPVDSERIGHEVLDRLRSLDQVAYLRFASVYKDFQGVSDFEREVAALEGGVTRSP